MISLNVVRVPGELAALQSERAGSAIDALCDLVEAEEVVGPRVGLLAQVDLLLDVPGPKRRQRPIEGAVEVTHAPSMVNITFPRRGSLS